MKDRLDITTLMPPNHNNKWKRKTRKHPYLSKEFKFDYIAPSKPGIPLN